MRVMKKRPGISTALDFGHYSFNPYGHNPMATREPIGSMIAPRARNQMSQAPMYAKGRARGTVKAQAPINPQAEERKRMFREKIKGVASGVASSVASTFKKKAEYAKESAKDTAKMADVI